MVVDKGKNLKSKNHSLVMYLQQLHLCKILHISKRREHTREATQVNTLGLEK